ncbi:hypothetical protein [Chryseobacterium sp. JK1]|uniref:hypothetical protein n=1 Tax=Chryseobacterium sp. JK1 TaxID=874294 RepID=UPI003D68CC12
MEVRIVKIIEGIKNKHLNDPTVPQDKDLIVEILLSDVQQAIQTLNHLDEDSLEWISSRFDYLVYKFQNKDFTACLKGLLIKFPKSVILKEDIYDAIEIED